MINSVDLTGIRIFLLTFYIFHVNLFPVDTTIQKNMVTIYLRLPNCLWANPEEIISDFFKGYRIVYQTNTIDHFSDVQIPNALVVTVTKIESENTVQLLEAMDFVISRSC